jgi:hypothetical protein
MWVCGKDLITKETLNVSNLSWQNKDSDPHYLATPSCNLRLRLISRASKKRLLPFIRGAFSLMAANRGKP